MLPRKNTGSAVRMRAPSTRHMFPRDHAHVWKITTRRSPIDLDIVESVQLVAADYSVTASNFTGGGVNVGKQIGASDLSISAQSWSRGSSRYADRLAA